VQGEKLELAAVNPASGLVDIVEVSFDADLHAATQLAGGPGKGRTHAEHNMSGAHARGGCRQRGRSAGVIEDEPGSDGNATKAEQSGDEDEGGRHAPRHCRWRGNGAGARD